MGTVRRRGCSHCLGPLQETEMRRRTWHREACLAAICIIGGYLAGLYIDRIEVDTAIAANYEQISV